ncbi:MAG: hypothetical protein ACR2NZ_00765 [Rubripirellula sp.]
MYEKIAEVLYVINRLPDVVWYSAMFVIIVVAAIAQYRDWLAHRDESPA